MKKGGTKKNQAKQQSQNLKISKPWLIFGVLTLLLAGFILYQKVIIPNQEKTKFVAAEKTVNGIKEEINEKYPPTTLSSNNVCESPSLKFKDVNPLCIFSSTLVYKNMNVEQANNRAKEIDAYLKTRNGTPKVQKESPTDFSLFGNKPLNYKTLLSAPNKGLRCLTTYSYQDKVATLSVSISCSGEANHGYRI